MASSTPRDLSLSRGEEHTNDPSSSSRIENTLTENPPASSSSTTSHTNPREIASKMMTNKEVSRDVLEEEDDEDRSHVRYGGPFYWEEDYDGEQPNTMDAAKDVARYAAFQAIYGMKFAGEVAMRFVGWDRSRYQWALEAVERQQREAEEAAIARLALGEYDDDDDKE